MKTFKLALFFLCVVFLALFSSEVRAQSPLSQGLQKSGSPPVVLGRATPLQAFDSLGGTPQALDPLPQTLAVLLGAPLADAIQQERNHAYPHAQPIPQA